MLRLNNLLQVYAAFPGNANDIGSLKVLELLNPNYNQITSMMLIESERLWTSTLMQLLASRELEKTWLQSWSDVTLYYADFFIMNSILRLAGRTITFSVAYENTIFKIVRLQETAQDYEISKVSRGDHKAQWNLYYDLVQGNITDDPLIREIFDVQLSFKHQESSFRQWVNYDLEYGYDERHNSSDGLKARADLMSSMIPYTDTIVALSDDYFSEIAKTVYMWKYLKTLLYGIADNSQFAIYFRSQITKLRDYVKNAPFGTEIKNWVLNEIK